jgi:hypothetical protein
MMVSATSYIQASPNHEYNAQIQLCIKNSGTVFIVGEGFRKADCRRNDRLISINTTGIPGPQGPR